MFKELHFDSTKNKYGVNICHHLKKIRYWRHEDLGSRACRKMWSLTEEETQVMFEKMAKYILENLQLLVNRCSGTYCF